MSFHFVPIHSILYTKRTVYTFLSVTSNVLGRPLLMNGCDCFSHVPATVWAGPLFNMTMFRYTKHYSKRKD